SSFWAAQMKLLLPLSVTVGVSSEAKQLNSWRVSDYTPEYHQTKSIGKRKLLTPDEILRLPLDTALVILCGQKVLKALCCDTY
ncbi:MAG: type IV secretory system conjugative DNA transfer family protein, partial [Thomasclavelia spiroformis]